MGQVLEGHEGNPIGADEQHRMRVFATIFTEDHYAAMDGDAYVMDLDGIGTNGAEHIAVIKNTDDRDLIVTEVSIWVATFKDDTFVEVLLNETFTYVAGGTVNTPVNLKSGISGGADGEFYTIAAPGTDITTFGGTAVYGGRFIFTTTPLQWKKDSGWIVPKNQVWSLYNNGNDNTFRGYIAFYYKE